MSAGDQMIPSTPTTYQEGSFERVSRVNGPDVWMFRWREKQPDGKNVQRRKVIGNLNQLPNLANAKRAAENLRSEINARRDRIGKMTVAQAWGHFQLNELNRKRSPTTIQNYKDYFKCYILPNWAEVDLDEVETVAVEEWLDGLPMAPATRAKIRNHMSCLFSHCIRHKLYRQMNPITEVRTSSIPVREAEYLELEEIQAILMNIGSDAIRVMMAVAAGSALRRSEVRGLKWKDLDFTRLWFNLKRGLVRTLETDMKTRASRRGVPLLPELAEILQNWRRQTPYCQDEDWVFASPYTHGKRPYWPESALVDHIRPAAKKAGIAKHVGWHTFRHSVGTLLDEAGANLKTVQEILRHANSRITADVYQHGNIELKRNALGSMSGIFVVPPVQKVS
jgi:integrase